ncbi:MAG TPA: amidohydrolase family protein [Gaiellaceae bacterium]|nr:amidohydrolase family protein [Gaiellaceae bacterium]
MAAQLRLPGFVNAHSHAFQRTLRGSVAGADFWGWRDAMLAVAAAQTPERVRREYAAAYREMLAAGYTAVGEFHYLGLEEARAAIAAGEEAGVVLVLLLAAYGRGGLDRFRQRSPGEYLRQVEALREEGANVGLAPHSVRACPLDWLEEIGRYAEREGLVLHVHAGEQAREVEECLAEHGVRPIELLARAGCLSAGTTVVHATQADDRELDLLADTGARVCVCPTTEANLGDGFAPVERIVERGIPLCVGSDSNVRIDPFEELRELEGIARRTARRRNVVAPEALLRYGAEEGARALGLENWPDVEIDLGHVSLRGIERRDVPAALVFGCGAEVVATG